MLEEKLNTCVRWWLQRGYKLLPCQPNKKFLLSGYGEFRSHLETLFEIEMLIDKFPHCNFAVLGNEKKIILDFDDAELYMQWSDEHPAIAETYTEKTPRGGYHVFIDGDRPKGLILKPGVELKNICLVAPSMVDGKQYVPGDGEILSADPEEVFSSLSRVGTPTVRLLKAQATKKSYEVKRDKIPEGLRPRRPHGSIYLIDRIKSENELLHVFGIFRPETNIDTSDRYVMVLCPFHEDHKPSMFLDRDKQMFRCFGCGEHGDVINLYAKFAGIPVREAIARMARQGVKS